MDSEEDAQRRLRRAAVPKEASGGAEIDVGGDREPQRIFDVEAFLHQLVEAPADDLLRFLLVELLELRCGHELTPVCERSSSG